MKLVKMASWICFAAIILAPAANVHSAGNDWLESPRPKYPSSALKNYSEGSVKLQILLAADGSVRKANIVKSSGNAALDEAAQQAVLRWKLKRSVIRPADLTKGREEIIEFRQEASAAVVYRHSSGGFEIHNGKVGAVQTWMFAPPPPYPEEARWRHEEGQVVIGLTIGRDGKPENVRVVKSSNYPILDQATLQTVLLWRAHKQYAGRKLTIPVTFHVGHRRP